MSPMSDGQLMRWVSTGDIAAFSELYDRYRRRAFGVAFSVCRDVGRAEEAVQEGFLAVWKSRATYCSQRGTVAGWVLTVVRHRAIDLMRSNERHEVGRTSDALLVDQAGDDDVLRTTLDHDNGDRLRASLASLPEVQQQVIALAFFGQLSHAEIASRLGLPSGTVKGRMRLGLEKLRTNIEEPVV